MFPQDGYVSTGQVAIFLGLSPRTLERWRTNGVGPKAYVMSAADRTMRAGELGRPPVRYKAEEVRQWPQAHSSQGLATQRAWAVEEGRICGEAIRTLEPADLAIAWELDTLEVMTLPEALLLPWRSADDLAPYAREAVEQSEQIRLTAEAAMSKARMEGTTST